MKVNTVIEVNLGFKGYVTHTTFWDYPGVEKQSIVNWINSVSAGIPNKGIPFQKEELEIKINALFLDTLPKRGHLSVNTNLAGLEQSINKFFNFLKNSVIINEEKKYQPTYFVNFFDKLKNIQDYSLFHDENKAQSFVNYLLDCGNRYTHISIVTDEYTKTYKY